MRFRSLAFVLGFLASACQAATPDGEQRAESLVRLAKAHLGVDVVTRSVEQPLERSRRGLKQVSYETPTDGRFATYYVTPEGSLKEFVVNQPGLDPYKPIQNRLAFIEQMMEIAVPEASNAERAWGAQQLNMH